MPFLPPNQLHQSTEVPVTGKPAKMEKLLPLQGSVVDEERMRPVDEFSKFGQCYEIEMTLWDG